jgi:hypothetical protein
MQLLRQGFTQRAFARAFGANDYYFPDGWLHTDGVEIRGALPI